MGNGFIALLLAAGVSAWIYSKVMHSTGGQTKSALTVAVISGVLLFFLTLILLGILF